MRITIHHGLITSVNLFIISILFFGSNSNAQSTNYTSLYTSANFVKTIDLSRPVGTIGATAEATAFGGAAYSIPIFTPPGTNGLVPSLNISYSSQKNNGNAGYGWDIGGLSAISRAGKNIYHNGVVTPVTYTSDDAFLLGGMRLNAITGSNGANGTIYAGETESFAQVLSYTTVSANNPDWFKVIAKDGSITEFGHTADSRILTDNGQNVLLWRLNKIIDINGNYIEFKYINTDRDSRIDQILYTGNSNTGLLPYNQMNFSYTIRSDINTNYEAGASVTSKYLLDKITLVHTPDAGGSQTVKTYKLNFGFDNVHSMLKEIVEYGGDETAPALNSTIFLYGDPPQNLSYYTAGLLTGNYDLFPGDFNADGKSDVLAAQVVYSGGIKYHPSYSLFSDINNGGGGTVLYSCTTPGNSVIGGTPSMLYNFLTSDYNKDGRDDVLFLTPTLIDNNQTLFFNTTSVILNKTGSHNPQTGYTDYVTQNIPYPSTGGYNYQHTTATGKSFIPGDFDGDGNQDYILIVRNTNNKYKAFLTSPATGEINLEINNFGIGTNPYPDSYAQTVLEADRVIPIDFDGDGKMELLVTKNNTTYVVNLQRTTITSGYFFAGSVVYTTSTITKNCRSFAGDFNGDSKTDLLMHYDNNSWGLLYSNGVSFAVASIFTFQQSVGVSGYDVTDKIVVADFNGDGKTDILHGYNYSSASKLSLYYSKGASSAFFYEQYSHNGPLNMSADMPSGDFNGDGRNDLINRFATSADFIFIKPMGTELLLSKATNGHNATTSFDYKLLTDKITYPYVYDRTISLDDPANQNPFNYVQFPMYVVAGFSEPDGIGGVKTTSFSYENAVVHRAAKGFLGFKKITTKNLATGITSIIESNINTQFAVPYPIKQTTKLTSTGEVLAESQITNSFVNLSTGYFDIRYLQKVDKILNIDYFNGRAAESVNTFDNYANITTNVTKKGVLSGATVDPTETITTTTVFSIHNTPVPAKPDNFTVTNLRVGMPSLAATTAITYSTNGLPVTQTIFYGLPKAVTTTNTYNSFGNPLTTVTSSSGLNSRTITNTYDAKGRFVLSKQSSGINVSQTSSSTYDSKWGVALSSTSSDCITTMFEYDVFGRPKKINLPEGYSVNKTLNWDVQGNYVYYSLTDYDGGSADKKIWFDKLGREIKTQTAGLYSNNWSSVLTNYNNQGKVASSTNNYFSSYETALTTTNNYDAYGRLVSQANALGTTQYSYALLSGGKVTLTVTNPAGQASSKTADPAERIISSTDNGGQMDFTYDSRGNQVEIKHSNTTLVTSAYDVYSRQTSMTDVNAGTTSYTYDAFGQLMQQTDAKGTTYNMVYDDLGRQVTKTGPEGTITYEYYKDVSTGCNNNNLSKLIGYNGVIKEYTFDALKRPLTEKVTVDGTNYITSFTYDSYGKLHKTTYPSGVEVVNTYEQNGYIQKIDNGEPFSGPNLFWVGNMNGSGQFTNYDLGNGITTVKTFSYGIPTRFRTLYTLIQDLYFTFDNASGNLLTRFDALKNKGEDFEYDNLNRLKRNFIQNIGHPPPQITVTYDDNSGTSRGNIIKKTDGGVYTYSNTKLHAVAYTVDQFSLPTAISAASHDEQLITYTPFLKAASITEGIYQLNFTYGPDQERVKTELKTNGVVTETRYYFGSYEKQIKNGVTRDIHYVSDGVELVSILVKENGVTSPYFVYTDHLGSILTVTDAANSAVVDRNFDAWGRRRVPKTWTSFYAPTTIFPDPDWLYRGYTGHEMLPHFGLINMNGRIYDPVLGRMLSPDNYVQEPFNSQNYNRYTYCLNNPLKYKDPTGQYFIIDDFFNGYVRGFFGSGGSLGQRIRNAVQSGANQAGNSAKIWGGLFTGNFRQIFSRLTWESPQTVIGLFYAQASNTYGDVERVDYFDGATVLQHRFGLRGSGVTIGSFINGDNTIRPNPNNPLFQHEYGHYLQSQASGWAYFPRYAIPSLFSRNTAEHQHIYNPVEQDANVRAIEYFFNRTGGTVQWNFVDNPIGPLGIGTLWTMANYNTIDFQLRLSLQRLQVSIFDYIWPVGMSMLNTMIARSQY